MNSVARVIPKDPSDGFLRIFFVHCFGNGFLFHNLVDDVEESSSASDRITLGYQADIAFGQNLLSLATEFERTQFKQRGAVNFGDPNQDLEIDTTSGIVDFQGRTGANVTYLLSARYDNHSDFDNALTGPAASRRP